jgi:hypothetical protein
MISILFLYIEEEGTNLDQHNVDYNFTYFCINLCAISTPRRDTAVGIATG